MTLLVLLLVVASAVALVLGYQLDRERSRRRQAELNAATAERQRADLVEALGLAGEARRTLRAEHAAEVERLTADHARTVADLAVAIQRIEVAGVAHANEVRHLNAELEAAREAIGELGRKVKAARTELES